MSGLALDAVSLAQPGDAPPFAPLFAPLTLTVPPGQVTVVMGPSGIGKSTLLAHIAGVLGPDWSARGRVTLDGRDLAGVPAERRRVGLMFQDALLFPHLSVGANLAFGLAPGVRGRAARRAAVEEALRQAGLAGMADRDPASLSGGQSARVALMRTLLARPRALLLDEPFSRLDTALRADLRAFVFAHATAAAIPVLLVTHDAADAAAAGGLVIQLRT